LCLFNFKAHWIDVIDILNKGFKTFFCFFHQVVMGSIILFTNTYLTNTSIANSWLLIIFRLHWGIWLFTNFIIVCSSKMRSIWWHSKDMWDLWHLYWCCCCCFFFFFFFFWVLMFVQK
jgi:hypothetical protein